LIHKVERLDPVQARSMQQCAAVWLAGDVCRALGFS